MEDGLQHPARPIRVPGNALAVLKGLVNDVLWDILNRFVPGGPCAACAGSAALPEHFCGFCQSGEVGPPITVRLLPGVLDLPGKRLGGSRQCLHGA